MGIFDTILSALGIATSNSRTGTAYEKTYIFEEDFHIEDDAIIYSPNNVQDAKRILAENMKNEILISHSAAGERLMSCMSKIGGNPDVPEDFVWPEAFGKPLSFIAQFNLAEVAPFDKENMLPKTGMLSFFCGMYDPPYGIEPNECDSVKVFFFTDLQDLRERKYPEGFDEWYILPERMLSFESKNSIVDFEDTCGFDSELYESAAMVLDVDSEYSIKLLGYPKLVQGSFLHNCELLSRGYNYKEQLTRAEEIDVEKCAKDWVLLFQMDSLLCDEYSLPVGDAAVIYFMIRKEDLEDSYFYNVRAVIQAC